MTRTRFVHTVETATMVVMAERIHDDELDTAEATVRALLRAQCPQWSQLPLSYLRTSGTDHAMWRICMSNDDDVVVRLPRRARSGETLRRELELLTLIATSPLAGVVATPTLRHMGEPTDAFPHPWAVLDWLDGSDAWTVRHDLEPSAEQFAVDLAAAIRVIGRLTDLPASTRQPGERGGPIEPLLVRLDRWLCDPAWNATELLDVDAVKRSADECFEVAGEPIAVGFVHGDLIPGNLLTQNGRLTAIIDWGGAAYADPAQDLGPAWSVFDERGRRVFRDAVGADDATWLRARTFELEHAIGGVLYYTPRHHPLADVMARTLRRILHDE